MLYREMGVTTRITVASGVRAGFGGEEQIVAHLYKFFLKF